MSDDLVRYLRAWADPYEIGGSTAEMLDKAAARIERLEAFVGKVRASEVEFVVFDGDDFAAGGTGRLEDMQREAAHYAMMYGPETTTEFYVRVPLEALAELDK